MVFFKIGNFAEMPYKNFFFDSVCDVFSSCCLDKLGGKYFVAEVNRILKKGGKFFLIFHQKNQICSIIDQGLCMIKIL